MESMKALMFSHSSVLSSTLKYIKMSFPTASFFLVSWLDRWTRKLSKVAIYNKIKLISY